MKTVTCVDSGDKALKYLGLNIDDVDTNDSSSTEAILESSSPPPLPLQLQEVINSFHFHLNSWSCSLNILGFGNLISKLLSIQYSIVSVHEFLLKLQLQVFKNMEFLWIKYYMVIRKENLIRILIKGTFYWIASYNFHSPFI